MRILITLTGVEGRQQATSIDKLKVLLHPMAKSTDLGHAGEPHDRTLSLSIRKRDGMFAIRIGACKHVAVLVENFGFEMVVFAPSVFAEFSAVLVRLHAMDTTTARSVEIAPESQLPVRRLTRWDEKAGLRRDAIRSQGSTRSRRNGKETGL